MTTIRPTGHKKTEGFVCLIYEFSYGKGVIVLTTMAVY